MSAGELRADARGERPAKSEKILGGCPCGFWSASNCWYVQRVGICSPGKCRSFLEALDQFHASRQDQSN